MAYEPIKPLRGGGIISSPRVSDVRKPNWDVWQLVPEARLWEAVALSLDTEPRKVRFMRDGWMAGPGAGPFFEEGQDFEDRLLVAETNFGTNKPLTPRRFIMRSRRTSDVSLPQFAAWVQKIGWEAPAELLALADEQVAIKADRAHSGKRTGAATATREAGKTDRLEDLRRFVEDLCAAGRQVGLVLEAGKPLPFAVGDLHTLFILCARWRGVSLSTFTDDLPKIDVKLKPGSKRYTVGDLAKLLAGKFSG